MFEQTLKLHWKSAKWFVLPLLLLCFSLPQLAARMGEAVAEAAFPQGAEAYLTAVQLWVPFLPLLALLCGTAAALGAWAWDHKVNHVYALSLPVTRRRYALLKMGAGAALLLPPALALLAGALIVDVFYGVPDGLRVYSFSITSRFLLAALIGYALIFALAAGTIRTTIWILGGIVVLLIGGSLLTPFLNSSGLTGGVRTPIEVVIDAFTTWGGPFAIFGGNWMFIDV